MRSVRGNFLVESIQESRIQLTLTKKARAKPKINNLIAILNEFDDTAIVNDLSFVLTSVEYKAHLGMR